MDWSRTIDAYCERTDASFWSEPLNAVTNLAFLIAALVSWRRISGERLPLAGVLCALLALIGIGSFLFHTFATRWAALADTLPILAFILVYLFTANLHFLRLRWPLALTGVALFFPFAALVTPFLADVPLLGRSAAYLPVPLLILFYALLLSSRAPRTAVGLALGACILLLSLTARSADGLVCARLPMGTHLLWHVLNALMLGWMIEVYRRHMLAERGLPR
ncbi:MULTISPECIES: ceramidase domain-containing protein [unclassified Haematobacter]|uniref:ceramidase domain-containing protein n=1 Tax=unclassified Haematobacter TaxID=2640585 RepID=UPI0025B7E7A2|nr:MULTISPECIES: ceramidase domain-containing protein [unclassified Haematobacter]